MRPISPEAASLGGARLQSDAGGGGINVLDAIRILRAAGGGLFGQFLLHAQLAQVEWTEEKGRLGRIVLTTLVGFAFLLCLMLLCATLLLAVSWDTRYRIAAVVVLIAISGVGTGVACSRLRALVALGDTSFAATREELAADIALLKSKDFGVQLQFGNFR